MMEQKTKVNAEDGRQDLQIIREFDLPLNLLFKAYTDAEILEQWMGTKVLKLENRNHGSYRFETTDPKGNKHRFNGAVHEFSVDKKIIRTFEMEGTPFSVQLEFLEFEELTPQTSKLTVHTVFKSGWHRDEMLKMPFAYGINMAHARLQDVMNKLK
jgi:uncharacterized protein YndB with AHSA1/START domain